jgi:hypothetical protein
MTAHVACLGLAWCLVGLMAPVMAQEVVCSRTIVPGTNLVSFPMNTPLANAGDVCAAFGLSGHATTSISQFSGATVQSHTCDQQTPGFPLLASMGIGVRIIHRGAPLTALLTGSHDPAQPVTLPRAGLFPVGWVVYAYPATACSTTGQDICREANLADVTLMARYGSAGVVDATFVCSADTAAFPLRFCGEGVLIWNDVNGPASFVPRVQPCQ